ncbi:MAG TPA: enoyl-CoA hydratase-related protein [Paraburkholderia sp.]
MEATVDRDREGVRVERRGQTLIVHLCNERRRNALSVPVRRGLLDGIREAAADDSVRSVIVTGAGAHFSAGGDLTTMQIADEAAARDRLVLSHELVEAIARARTPVIAAVEGWAAGAGLSLALACDLIVGARTSKYVASFGKVGLMGDLGVVRNLPLRVGAGCARRILFYGEPLDAATAYDVGLIDHLAPDGATALNHALDCAERLTGIAPLAIAATKTMLADGLTESLAWERELQARLFLTDDHAEGKAAFVGKRAPRFKGK